MKKFFFLLVLFLVLLGAVVFLQYSSLGASFVWTLTDQASWFLPLVVVSALIDSINPCAFSILLLTVAFLLNLGRVRSNILLIGGFYIAGLFAVYLLIGLSIVQMLHLFNTPHFMGKLGAGIMIALGIISIFNGLFPNFPLKLKIPGLSHRPMAVLMEKASLPAAFLLGILVGLCEFPCTGGPYLTILGFLHDTGTYFSGFLYLLLYNLIFILPLAMVLLLVSQSVVLSQVEEWRRSNLRKFRIGSGIAMVLLALLILSF